MDAIKSMLSPLGMSTGAIQDTLVRCYLRSLPAEYLDIVRFRNWLLLVVQWRRRAEPQSQHGMASSIVCFEVLIYNKSSLISSEAFFLTAHFSQDDYPYDWYVLCSV